MKNLTILCLFALAAPIAAQDHTMGHMHSMARHQYVMREGVPEPYRDLVNPLTADASILNNGRRVYAAACSVCHGATGAGNGPGGAALDPAPSNIQRLPRMPMMSSDAYLYWTVAEGGAPIHTAMPAFGQSLTSDEIWSVILALREGI